MLEPGEALLLLAEDNFICQRRESRLVLQAWDQNRNLVRRIAGVKEESVGRLELIVERFARKEGRLYLVDLARPAGHDFERRGARLVFRERFRQFLKRLFPDWTLAELSADADLEHSLSPVHPRAFLRQGQRGWAAIAAPQGGGASSALSFGLIWLDYLRRRERRVTIEGLILLLPSGEELSTCLRLRYLDPQAARYEICTYSEQGFAARLDPGDYGNLETHLECCRQAIAQPELEGLLDIPGVERVTRNDGSSSFRVHGLEFAQAAAGEIRAGLAGRAPATGRPLTEIEQLARELADRRSPLAGDRDHPLFRQNPEAWLESQVREQIETVDAGLLPAPLYGQVPAFAGGERDVIDLLAVDRSGRLAVIEIKATADLHLPLQALDYWMRVEWHATLEEFGPNGYFPGIALKTQPPRLFLISPALEFHPSTETILGYFSPAVDVERVGLGLEWRKRLEVMFRLRGAERP